MGDYDKRDREILPSSKLERKKVAFQSTAWSEQEAKENCGQQNKD